MNAALEGKNNPEYKLSKQVIHFLSRAVENNCTAACFTDFDFFIQIL